MAAFGDTPQNEIYEEIKNQQAANDWTPMQTMQMLAEIMAYIAETEQ